MTRVFRIIGETIRSLGLADQPRARRGGRA